MATCVQRTSAENHFAVLHLRFHFRDVVSARPTHPHVVAITLFGGKGYGRLISWVVFHDLNHGFLCSSARAGSGARIMPGPKRKQKDVTPTAGTAKRRRLHRPEKATPSTDHDGGAGGDFYAIKDIIEESKNAYKVDWEDDPATGKKYSPTWVSARSLLAPQTIAFIHRSSKHTTGSDVKT